MAEQQTCGMGLAQNSPLPGTMADIADGVAANLEAHMTALDTSDEKSRNEKNAYEELVEEWREVAARLKTIAKQMAGYRDLEMGRHDQKAMGGDQQREAFESLVKSERDLHSLLTDKIEGEEKMLAGLAPAKSSD